MNKEPLGDSQNSQDENAQDSSENFFKAFKKQFKIDIYLLLPLMLFLIHIRLWTFIILVSIWAFFGILQLRGISIDDFRARFKSTHSHTSKTKTINADPIAVSRKSSNSKTMFALLLIIICSSFTGYYYYYYKAQPSSIVFIPKSDATPAALNQPKNSEVLKWAPKASIAALAYDFVNYQKSLKNAEQYFTKDGYTQFLKHLESSRSLEVVKKKELVVTAVLTGKPVIIKEGMSSVGQYAWLVQFPIRKEYLGASEKFSQNLIVNLLITHDSNLASEKGLRINSLVEHANE
tara:strand:+ start:75199 stop:76071 length:873 start_codon:yes stop_codon:yes gene_type:complete